MKGNGRAGDNEKEEVKRKKEKRVKGVKRRKSTSIGSGGAE
jgi:hypothetical protein